MAYDRDSNGCAMILFALLIAVPLASRIHERFGWSGLVVAVAIMSGGLALYSLVHRLRIQRKKKSQETMPCQHGIMGAAHNRTRCPTCMQEVELRAEKARQQAQVEQERCEVERARRYAEWVARIRLPEYLQSMDPLEFERLVCELFRRLDYEVEATPYVGDGGADGYLRKNGALSILQCKRVHGSVGEPILRDLFGTMHAAGATSGVIVTTGRVSRQARQWVQGKPIHIVELAELRRLLDEHFSENDIVPATFSPLSYHDGLCLNCGRPLKVRRSRRGRFMGCTGYPVCRYTRSVRG